DVTAPDPTSLLTPWETLFTDTFTNLSAIGTEWLKDPAPVLMALLANPSLITDLPSAVFSTLSTPLTITTSDLTSVPLTLPIMIDIMLGAPLVLGLGAVGPLATTSGALETFYADLISGNPTTVLTALIDGPANIANAYLNGSVGLPDVLGEPLNLLNGILVPDGNFDVTVGTDLITQLLTALNVDPTLIAPIISFLDGLPTGDLATISVGPFGGLADALINYVPQQIAAALTADPTTDGTGLLSVLDPSTLLSGLDLGNLGGLLDPSTLVGDLTALLPSAAADLPAGLADLATAIPF
ncbi:MAG TPA: hypothetical protein VE400_14635, partial [Mycobacterium sp.]|nr:hypothetical protein [Mycobacterium sp.]